MVIAASLGIIVSLVILPLVIVSINLVVKNGEQKFTEQEVIRVENIIRDEIDRTSRTLGDWSNWNDTYEFAVIQNQDFVENNLFADTFINLDINAIVILDKSHQIIYANYFDDDSQSITNSPIDFSLLIKEYPELTDTNTLGGYKGLASLQDQLMIIASNPILTSLNEGPPTGNIIFIKTLSDHRINDISKITLRQLGINPVSTSFMEEFKIPAPSMLNDGIYVVPKSTEIITGYKYLADLHHTPILVLHVDNPRDLYLQGRTTKIIVIVILAVLILFISIITFFLYNHLMEAREHRKEDEIAAEKLESARLNAIELEKRVLERTRELEIKNKDLETFNYTVSHDLKSPLRGISGYSNLLINDHANQLDSTGMDYLVKINASAFRMDQLIQDLLTYTKTNRDQITKTKVSLDELCDTLLLEYEEEILNRNIVITKDFDCESLFIDRDGIALVLRNLLDNAIKFTKNNSNPNIAFKCKTDESKATISISDNGVGFDSKFHKQIFDIFERLHLAEEYPGTGIGLALVKKTMERFGGNVYAESQIGVGSTFYLEIPL